MDFFYCKLQIGCLFVILYLIASYLRGTAKCEALHDRYFSYLLVASPVTVFFDGLTAWTVNHLDFIPDVLNRVLHFLFIGSIDLNVIISALYMFNQIVAFNKRENILFLIPGFISLILITLGIGTLEFRQGRITNFSMGFSAYVCFCSVILYYGSIIGLIIFKHKYISNEKKVGTITFITLVGILLLIQIIFPEVLLSSVCVTIMMLGIYMDFENPAIKKQTLHNEKMVESFATMVESRDNSTGEHIKRTRAYVNLILQKMKSDRHYADIMSKDYITYVTNASPLHDIGKVSTPDKILQKPGTLTAEEYEIMKNHAALGGDIIRTSFISLDNPEFLKIAYEVARYHHERYNGQGYPEGLVGEQIPLHARIMAIADVFDAVSQDRYYRKALNLDECFDIIEKGIGSKFDPRLAKIFLDARKEVEYLLDKS